MPSERRRGGPEGPPRLCHWLVCGVLAAVKMLRRYQLLPLLQPPTFGLSQVRLVVPSDARVMV
jgi:hypothetical protein